MKYIFIVISALVLSAALFWGTNQNESDSIQTLTKSQIYKANAEHFRQMFHDPETGEIPEGIRQRELLHAELFDQEYDLKHNKSLSDDEKDMIWYEAGPNDVGGRTRALAVHCEDSDLIIAGGVSGGIWKSSDRGASWHLKSDISHSHSVSALAQDTRIGHTNVWYYGTGEFTKNSVTDLTFRENYYGNGIYKSTNEGETWRLLENAKSKYAGGEEWFNFISRLAVSPTTGTIFAAANNYGILRSDDEGESFYVALGGNDNYRYSDVSVASDGTVYAVLSEYGTNHARRILPGVWKSTDDGNYFENITPNDFPSKHERSVIAVAPSNPEVVYVLTYTGLVNDYNTNDIRLFYINTGTGVSEDRTVNLPLAGGYTSILNAQGGYNLLISVKPDDENFVLVGGTNLYRSFDGFKTKPIDIMESWIAGYHPKSYKYPGQHPDLHICAFVPDEPNKMWSGHDGGLSYCDDITAATNDSTDLEWTNMNNGYNVTQFYNVALADNPRDFRLICGSQDNGSPYFISNGKDISESRDISGGDGAFCHLGENYAFSSVYFGRVLRHPYDDDDNPKNGSLVSPPNAKGELFFNAYVVDPLDDEIMYFPSGRELWRNIEMHAPNNEVRDKWEQMSGFEIPPGYSITAINVSKNNPHNLLYFAASSRWDNPMKPMIFRMENANNELADVIEVSIPTAPRGAHVSSIAISPHNGDEILITMSNYNVTSVYLSTDGGFTYESVEGNLGNMGDIPGPAITSSSILPLGLVTSQDQGVDGVTSPTIPAGLTVYLVGTTTGLYSTLLMQGSHTIWKRESARLMGNVLVFDIKTRYSDNYAAAATFGRGVFITKGEVDLSSVDDNIAQNQLTLNSIYPNPAKDYVNVEFNNPFARNLTYGLYDISGKIVRKFRATSGLPGNQSLRIETGELKSGVYLLELSDGLHKTTAKIVVSN